MNTIQDNVQKWFELSKSGKFVEAKDFYFDNLFEEIIDNFISKTSIRKEVDVLFSVLGFTPEPIILTQRALNPKIHVIFYTASNEKNFEREIVPYLEKFLTSSYKLVELNGEDFDTIFKTMSEEMKLNPAREYAIDITGGKKSMVASASIFAKEYNFNVLYVDYSEYNPDLRRPTPGSEILNWVYDPYVNRPDLFSFE
jgi:hypothetical protein